jgi:hypothetical protein
MQDPEAHISHIIPGETLAVVLRTEKKNNGAEFTVRSRITGKDYTYKISRAEFNSKWYTHIKTEQGYLNFVRLGSYYNGCLTNKKQLVNTPAADAICWVLRQVERQDYDKLNANVELMHLGKCLVCGRPLTDAESIEIGIGPVCRKR